MSIKITIPNSSSDVLTFGSGNTPTAAQIAGIDSGSSNGQLAFYTTASGTSTERVRVDASGNVGIGTASPIAKLQVAGGRTFLCANSELFSLGLQYNSSTGQYYLGATNSATPDLVFSNVGGTERMRLDSSGNLLVGQTAASQTTVGSFVKPNGEFSGCQAASTNAGGTQWNTYSTGAGAFRFYVGMGGTVFATSTTISAISDIRYKENVRDLNVGLAEIMALQPRLYDWKEGKGADIKNARGFIAQEFEQVFPDLIDEWKDPAPEGEDPYKSVRADLIPVLVKAIQEQQAIITSLTDRITALEGATS
jgi:hypothetical protein